MAIAGDLHALIDWMDMTFTAGQLGVVRSRMEEILATIPIDDADPGPGQRGQVQTAALLIVTSTTSYSAKETDNETHPASFLSNTSQPTFWEQGP